MSNQRKSVITGLLMGLLTGSALLLGIANFSGSTARADAARDRDYQIVTAKAAGGSDLVYVINNTTGQVAIFEYDATSRGLRLRDVRPMTDVIAPIPGR